MSSFGDKLPLDLRCWHDSIGEQLGQAVGSLIDELASVLHKQATHSALGHMPKDEAFDMMLNLHREVVRKDE